MVGKVVEWCWYFSYIFMSNRMMEVDCCVDVGVDFEIMRDESESRYEWLWFLGGFVGF